MQPQRRRPQAVLFACSENCLRSPMAEAFGRHYFGRSVYFASAGVRRGELDPLAVAAMEESGIDIAGHHPHTFEDLEDAGFDLIVTLSPEAHHKALEFTRTLATDVIYWPTLDPSAVEGSREHVLNAYRSVRDTLAARIKAFFDPRPADAQEEPENQPK
ncbi:MAG: arsenate-mycothiol transferase ArsC [Methylovirgula sp.]